MNKHEYTKKWRDHAIMTLAKRSDAYDADPLATIDRARKAMNAFYRLAGLSVRLFYANNNEAVYRRHRAYIEEQEKVEEKGIKRISGYLEEFKADILYNGIYPSVIDRQRSVSGGVRDLNLAFYYD